MTALKLLELFCLHSRRAEMPVSTLSPVVGLLTSDWWVRRLEVQLSILPEGQLAGVVHPRAPLAWRLTLPSGGLSQQCQRLSSHLLPALFLHFNKQPEHDVSS